MGQRSLYTGESGKMSHLPIQADRPTVNLIAESDRDTQIDMESDQTK